MPWVGKLMDRKRLKRKRANEKCYSCGKHLAKKELDWWAPEFPFKTCDICMKSNPATAYGEE